MNDDTHVISHEQYDKISDDIAVLGYNLVFRFNVSLSKVSNGKRYSYHKEYAYTSAKTDDKIITVRRSFDYFLTFENILKRDDGSKAYTRIGATEFIALHNSVKKVYEWFSSNDYDNLFAKSKGHLVVRTPVPSEIVPNLPMGKYIKFSPTVIQSETKQEEFGIAIDLGDGYINNITVERLMALLYHLNTFNMYQAAQNMINYIGRPEYGTNLTSFDSQSSDDDSRGTRFPAPSACIGRKIGQ